MCTTTYSALIFMLLATFTTVRSSVANQTSALRVAVCHSGQAPFVVPDIDGKPAGYDVDIWNQVYLAMMARADSVANDPALNGTIPANVLAMIGTEPPPLLFMTEEEILAALPTGTVDVGMCGLVVTPERMKRFDFTKPFYLLSGFQSAIKSSAADPSVLFVITALVGTVDFTGQLILLILVIGVVVFGHLVAAAENLKLSSREEFRDNYFEGTQDGMWFSIVVMSTVGFGDIAPRTTGGRFLTIIWIFISIALMAMLLAIVTSNFGKLVLVQARPESSIVTQADLLPYRVGTASEDAASVLRRNPNQTVVAFPNNAQAVAFAALLNGTVDVVVDRPETIQYYSTMNPDFEGKIRAVGLVFSQRGVSFGVGRSDPLKPHPLLHLLSLAVADATRGERTWQMAADAYVRWFGGSSSQAAEDAGFGAEQDQVVSSVRSQAATALIVVFLAWIVAGLTLAGLRFPAYQANNHLCDAARRAAGIDPEAEANHAARAQALRGLAGLARGWLAAEELGAGGGLGGGGGGGSGGGSGGGEDKDDCLPQRADVAPLRADEAPAPRPDASDLVHDTKVPVRRFIQHVAATLAREHARTRWYHVLTLRDYARCGEATVRAAFLRSYKAVAPLIEDFEPARDDMWLSLDALAMVAVDMVSRDAPGWYKEGGLLFPFRAADSDKMAADRAFEELGSRLRLLQQRAGAGAGRIDAICRACAAAADPDQAGPSIGAGGEWMGPGSVFSGRVASPIGSPRDTVEREVWYGAV